MIRDWFPEGVNVVQLRDAGTTGNFEITLPDGTLIHSKRTEGHGFLHENETQQGVVKAAIEAALAEAQ